jgi:hypothetical protein
LTRKISKAIPEMTMNHPFLEQQKMLMAIYDVSAVQLLIAS